MLDKHRMCPSNTSAGTLQYTAGNKNEQIKKALLLPSSKLSDSFGASDRCQEGNPDVGNFYSEPKRLLSSSWVFVNS